MTEAGAIMPPRFAPGKAQLCRSRRFERRQDQYRQVDAEQPFARLLGQAPDTLGSCQVDQQHHGRARHQLITGKLHDADAAGFDQAGDPGGRTCDHALAFADQLRLIVGHQSSAALDQAQSEVGLAGARRPAQQRRAPAAA
jgi:hypothetical protein